MIYQKEISEEGWTWFWKDRIQPVLESDSAELAKARIDIDHNGVVETVFRFRFTGCEVREAWLKWFPLAGQPEAKLSSNIFVNQAQAACEMV